MAEQITTFWKFINNKGDNNRYKNNGIEIPIIQRDYAQGRLGKEYLRRSFLKNLKEALGERDEILPNKEKRLKLDFVYGSINTDDKLQPLDGQQRLTTLWLLHWYVALRAKKLDEETCAVFKRFSYETRITSREFCQSLCEPKHFEAFTGNNIAAFIKNSTWFYSAWKQDPTIQSMLRMLEGTKINDKNNVDIIDGLEELFEGKKTEDFERYWTTLVSDDAPIVFYYQPLEDFGLSDDLYVKMNARGKQLTAFENFKADLIGYIRENAENDDKWKGLLDASNGIPIKMDTKWMDVFWRNRTSDNKVDEIYYAFLNRFFWNELFIAKDKDSDKYVIQPGKENDNLLYELLDEEKEKTNKYTEYAGLTPYKFLKGEIPLGLFENLQTVLDKYLNYKGDIPHAGWMKDFDFIPQYQKDEDKTSTPPQVKPINQIQRILFFALCKYFKEGKADEAKEAKEQSLTRWMRVVYNLVSGRDESDQLEIRSIGAVRNAIEHIGRLDSHDVYKSLCYQKKESGDLGSRWTEEIYKAQQILNDDRSDLRCYDGRLRKEDNSKYVTWEKIIVEAENYAFFHGTIRFLFLEKVEFTQNEGKNGEEKEEWICNWDFFEEKLENAREYFKRVPSADTCMSEKFNNAELLKVLISKIRKEEFNNVLWWKHKTFNNKPTSWLYYLTNSQIMGAVHYLMLGGNKVLRKASTDVIENILFLLSNTKLLDFVIKKIQEVWIRKVDYNGYPHKVMHIPNHPNEPVFLDAQRRNKFLIDTRGIIVDANAIIDRTSPDSYLLYGLNIYFEYKGKWFRWEWNDHIYMMCDNEHLKYEEKPNIVDEADKYYCFDTTGKNDDEIIEEMKKLIEEKELNKQHDVNAE